MFVYIAIAISINIILSHDFDLSYTCMLCVNNFDFFNSIEVIKTYQCN
jgi:hypothetical protein